MRTTAIAAALWLLSLGVASAGEEVIYRGPASWVDIAPMPAAPPEVDGATATRLYDLQKRIGRDEETLFFRRATEARTADGLSSLGTVRITWDPDYQTVTYHWVRLHRGAVTIEVLDADTRFTILRREENLEQSILTGRLTAFLQVEGAQAGDILDYAYTVSGRDPLVRDHSDVRYELEIQRAAGRVRSKILWQDGVALRWHAATKAPTVESGPARGWRALTYDAVALKADPRPTMAPARYYRVGGVEATTFPDWTTVAALMRPLYDEAQAVGADSAVPGLIAKIAAEHAAPEARALAALRLAQEQVRYFALALGDGGLRPATVDETWRRRFGDCKGKTVLLLALLKGLGLDAQPALVSTTDGEILGERLPSVDAFNHVIVRLSLGGKTYWLDPTRDDRVVALGQVVAPGYRWALPLHGDALEEIAIPATELPLSDVLLRVDLRGGLTDESPYETIVTARRAQAQSGRRNLATQGEEQLRERLIDPRNQQSDAAYKPRAVDWEDDPATDTFVTRTTGVAKTRWVMNLDIGRPELRIGATPSGSSRPRREGIHAGVPVAQSLPSYRRVRVEVLLPGEGAGWSAVGPTGAYKSGALEIDMATGVAGAVAFSQSTDRTLSWELPASEIEVIRRFEEAQGDRPFAVRAPAGAPMPARP